MARRLSQNLNSAFIEAANRLRGSHARKKIVVYVESFNDVFFWSQLLRPLETDQHYFEVMLPSRTSLSKGKKIAMGNRLGNYMIACVDADYDYLLQGATETSEKVCHSPYVFHTYVYAIENFQCYAPSLHQVCVMSTLNDHRIFDFEEFLAEYSRIIWPLFVWNVWAYRYGCYSHFSMLDFYHVVVLDQLNFYHPEQTLATLKKKVNSKIAKLQHLFPQGKKTYKPFMEQLLALGISPQETYLYMRGHDVYDGIVAPILTNICEVLRREREREIRQLAEHAIQMQNELAAYQHSTACVEEMLRKQTGYTNSPNYQRIIENIHQHLLNLESDEKNTK
jgi:hypothetical protein